MPRERPPTAPTAMGFSMSPPSSRLRARGIKNGSGDHNPGTQTDFGCLHQIKHFITFSLPILSAELSPCLT